MAGGRKIGVSSVADGVFEMTRNDVNAVRSMKNGLNELIETRPEN